MCWTSPCLRLKGAKGTHILVLLLIIIPLVPNKIRTSCSKIPMVAWDRSKKEGFYPTLVISQNLWDVLLFT